MSGRGWLAWLHRRPLAAFLLLGLSFLLFGAATVNLALLLQLNLKLWLDVGWQAAMDGALRQLGELLLSGYAAMAAYIVFKCCERVLVERLTRRDDDKRK
ncbi:MULTISPECIES: hypothetical protein [Chromobacteriaceae]|uniref:Uncharacterized protein n=3 Tax=Chromobacteriaceae TaxID=1499392 RepID=A0ABV0FGG3_9NEIS|nr:MULTISPECIES: hypothetical protein [Chromobacteriaceae]AVG17642.1 hypothetical protein CFN79_18215 [Chromobacterium vaccinii]ERE16315.1 hypothetical protein O166_03755 [Pseudogulbenkiania ferrooxidans EGD-HP2]MBX9346369.1 hypothetical protein [Chromobacterium vaccinii]MCD4503914.1 hypothetical protein [Chromobacterium piscinae]MCD5328928.1 hypothetical protein [Chromobacterium piscinae]